MIPKFISKNKKQFVLFDMDGVLAEYIAGEEVDIRNGVPNAYLNKRPINSIVSVAKELYEMPNITIGILSSCNFPSQAVEKKEWLKKYLPFITEDKIFIVVWSQENYTKETKSIAKLEVIQKIKGYDEIFLIEDTHKNISATNEVIPNCAHHLTELLD